MMWRLFIFIKLALGQQAPSAPAAFDRLGDGNCMTSAMLPVRGRSRRDMEHGECRGVCDTDNCIGYSYSPCERICTLHGEPELFRGLPLPERWSTLNGGGLIARTDLKCGTSCYVRKTACPGGTLRSAGAFMNYESLTYGLMRTLTCPFPHKGSVTILCTSTGINVEDGRCLRPCDEGFVSDDYFVVKYPPTRHGEYGYGNCTGDTLGNMTIFCSDGAATWVLGQCGINCPAGSLRSGSAVIFFPVLLHEERHTMKCPRNVGLECINEDTSLISGGCKQHCSAGMVNVTVNTQPAPAISGYLTHEAMQHGRGARRPCVSDDDMLVGELVLFCNDGNVTPDYSLTSPCRRHCAPGYIGQGMRGVSYGKIPHGQNRTLQCNPGYDGYILINCNDGEIVQLAGACYMDCIANTITSNTITLPHIEMKHGENTTVECPIETHRGNITVVCDDGLARMVEGFCGLNCSAGEFPSNGAVVQYPGIPHGFDVNVSCPPPWGDEIRFTCFMGTTKGEGRCGRQCIGGRLENNGASVFYGNLNHSEVGNFTCETLFQSELTFSGQLQLTCIDGGVVSIGQCFPDCSRGEITDQISLAKIIVPKLKASESIYTNCEPSEAYGMVTVSCLEGFQQVTSGTCGDPCPAGPFSSLYTRHTPIDLPEVYHMKGRWEDCPMGLSGRVYIHCENRVLRVQEGQCGERCPAQQIVMAGGSFNSPVMDHAETVLQPCLEPYSSYINLTCHFGELSVTSNCQLGCFAGSFTLPNGAEVSHPDLVSQDTYSPACPPGYVGQVTVICVNGTMERHDGACNGHCLAGRYRGDTGYVVNHEEILYNETSLVSCPIGYFGSLVLRCLGSPIIESGECMRNCQSGATLVREGIVMNNQDMDHNTLSNEMKCPRGYAGSIRLQCFDSLVTVHSGQCFMHCGGGQVQGAQYQGLNHEDYDSIICPEVGEIRIRCFDGATEVIDGQCLYGCSPGSVPDSNGVPLQYPDFPHDTRVNGTCSQDGVGQVELYCNNTVVTVVSTSQTCERHCPPQFTASADGSNISTPYIEHLQTSSVACPDNLAGTLGLRCQDFQTSIFDGICGDMNCRAGEVTSNGATLAHPAINDQRRAGPGSCGEGYLGEPVFECKNGITSVLAVNLIRQPRLPGIDNVSEVGSGYNFSEDDRFILCGCCLPPPPLPDVAALQGLDAWVVIYWAAGVGGVGMLIALAAGYWIFKKHPVKKVSQVTPEDDFKLNNNVVLPEDQLALPDAGTSSQMATDYGNNHYQLAIKDPPATEALKDARDGRRSTTQMGSTVRTEVTQSAQEAKAMPQMLKPRREGVNKDWQYW